MITLQQSPSLRAKFQQQVDKKIDASRQSVRQAWGDGLLGLIGEIGFNANQFQNQFKGSMGECAVSMFLAGLSDRWTLFPNALIPTNKPNILTEVDRILIGNKGIFLIEVKTWKGSFKAYRDKWQRREGRNWVEMPSSPSGQSLYHQQMFERWVVSTVTELPPSSICAPVVFPAAKWLKTTNCSVPVVQGIPALIELLDRAPECLSAKQVEEVSQAISTIA